MMRLDYNITYKLNICVVAIASKVNSLVAITTALTCKSSPLTPHIRSQTNYKLQLTELPPLNKICPALSVRDKCGIDKFVSIQTTR